MALSRNDLLQYDSKGVKKVKLEELKSDSNPKGEVCVKLYTGKEQQELADLEKRLTPDKLYIECVIRAVCDEEGNNLFTKEDIPALNNKPAKVLLALALAVNKHNGFTEEEIEAEAKN